MYLKQLEEHKAKFSCFKNLFSLLLLIAVLPGLHQFNIPIFLLGRETGRMMSRTLTLSGSGSHAGVGPWGWMQGKADALSHPSEQKQTKA